MSSFSFRITDKWGNILDLTPKRYHHELDEAKRNYSLVDRLEQGGSVLMGDGKVTGRKLNLSFMYAGAGATPAAQVDDVYTLLNTLAAFFKMRNAPFYATNLQRNVRAKVYGDFRPSHMQGNEYLILQNSVLALDMLDSDWEDVSETDSGILTMADSDELAIAIPGECSDIFPRIELTARADSETVFSVASGHQDSGAAFEVYRSMLITAPLFTVGAKILLDATDGQTYINGHPDRSMITSGYPLVMDSRYNAIRYTSSSGGGHVDLRVMYRLRRPYG